MKKHLGNLKVLMTLVFLLGFGQGQIWAINLILCNPGFEAGTPYTLPPCWSKYGGTFETSDEQWHTGGRYSGKYFPPANNARYATSDTVSVNGDSTYEWSVWYLDNNITAECYFKTIWCDASGAPLSGSSGSSDLGVHSTDNSVWQTQSGTVTAPPTARKVKFRCYIKGVGESYSGAIYFDDVSFGPAPARPTIITLDPTNITASSCTLRCTYTIGGESMVTIYFQKQEGEIWSSIAGSERERAGNGSYNFLFSGLIAGRTYRIRAGLTYASGTRTIYGAEKTFSTTPTAVGHMTINEFCGRSTFGDSNYEWVELYNSADDSINISGYTLWRTNGYTPYASPEITIPNRTCVCPHSFFLITDAGWTTGDNPRDGHPEWPEGNIADDITIINTNGGLKLCNSSGVVIDAVGWGDLLPEFYEGTPLSSSTLPQGKSWERISYRDTDDNANDFQLLDSPTPTRSNPCISSDINNEIENPQNFSLEVFPNPFNSVITISYEIPNPRMVSLEIYNLLGYCVANLVNEYKSVGNYTVTWNADNMPSGVYFAQITAGNRTIIKRMFFLK